jgi:hypothetical protein
MENDSFSLFSAKPKLPFVYCKRNGKRMFVFLGRQTINGNRRLLFQQTCPSMPISREKIQLTERLFFSNSQTEYLIFGKTTQI